jgi:hypothetical protein
MDIDINYQVLKIWMLKAIAFMQSMKQWDVICEQHDMEPPLVKPMFLFLRFYHMKMWNMRQVNWMSKL